MIHAYCEGTGCTPVKADGILIIARTVRFRPCSRLVLSTGPNRGLTINVEGVHDVGWLYDCCRGCWWLVVKCRSQQL